MKAQILEIQSKNKTQPISVVSADDFSYKLAQKVDARQIIESSNISLYCFDPENQQVIFVETPLEFDVTSEPFFHQAQYKYAQRLFAVSYNDFLELAKEIKAPTKLIFIYSVGRCGSTLLSKIFQQIPQVVSLSEPDTFSQLVGVRNFDGSNDELISQLLKSCILFLCKPNLKYQECCYVFKFRAFCIELADLIYNFFPDAKIVFMYRNPQDFVKSSISAFASITPSLLQEVEEDLEFCSRFVPLIQENQAYLDFKDPMGVNFYIISWFSVIWRYEWLIQRGVSMFTIKYEDLIAKPQNIIGELLKYCGLSVKQTLDVCQILKKDSQLGTSLSKDNLKKVKLEVSQEIKMNQQIVAFSKKYPISLNLEGGNNA